MKIQAPQRSSSRLRILVTLIRNKIRQHPLGPFLLLVVLIQSFYLVYDSFHPHYVPPPRKAIKPAPSAPLTPFYNSHYTGYSRSFPKWQHEYPCLPLTDTVGIFKRTPVETGLLYIKEMKTGSTTLSGVTARIARNMAVRHHGSNTTITDPCMARLVHLRARRLANRDKAKSFLWTVVREPAARIISKFYHFAVSRAGVQATLSEFKKYLHDNEVYDFGYYFKTLTMQKTLNVYAKKSYPQFLQQIFEDYNYIGVSERMDESLVVLQLILGLETEDILYLPGKVAGSYDLFNSKCVEILPTQKTPELKEFIYTPEMEDYLEPDVLFYRAANASLTKTIEALGTDRVNAALQKFKWAQAKAVERCAEKTMFPCSKTGLKQRENDCLRSDVACGYKCLDELSRQLPNMKYP